MGGEEGRRRGARGRVGGRRERSEDGGGEGGEYKRFKVHKGTVDLNLI